MYKIGDDKFLCYGDNLSIMKSMPKGCIDLIYLDPPFNSQKNYNLLYKNATGLPVPEQVDAFCDTWELDAEKENILREMPFIMKKYSVDEWMIGFWSAWAKALKRKNSKLLAYLVYMFIRLLEMRRILKSTGSIYLHCDPTASHHIKILMDGVFGSENFRNEIIWDYSGSSGTVSAKKQFPRKHDILLFYSNDYKKNFFQIQRRKEKRSISELKKAYAGDYFYCDDEGYIVWEKIKNRSPAKRFYRKLVKQYNREPIDSDRIFIMKNPIVKSVWSDIFALNPSERSKERLGYPTQKPIALLKRVISASCPDNGVIFDPFCGCGTTIFAVHELNSEDSAPQRRKWIGCDIAVLSIKLIQEVIKRKYGLNDNEHYKTIGIPVTVEQAKILFKADPFQFQHWAVEMSGGFCNTKKTGDKGVDGTVYFEAGIDLKSMVISVKGGKISPKDIRELIGSMKDNYEMGGFISLEKPSKQMKEEAAELGQYEYKNFKYDRIQLRTIEELLNGYSFSTPSKIRIIHKDKQYNLAFQ